MTPAAFCGINTAYERIHSRFKTGIISEGVAMNDFRPDMSVDIGGFKMKNPVMTASGAFGYGSEYADFVDLNLLGGVGVKCLTLEPRKGNPPPRICETPSGMLNTIGLQNVGVDAFLSDKLPYLRSFDTAVLVNLSGNTVNEYENICRLIDEVDGVHGIELNVSCPNIDKGGMAFGVDAEALETLVSKCKEASDLPVIVKLTPNVTDIAAMAEACEKAGADGLSLINTLLGMSIDVSTRRPNLSRVVGGLSGPSVKPIALRMVWEVSRAVSLPIIGMGGIMNAEDALEFILAGASAVAVGTANFTNPRASVEIVEEMERYFRESRVSCVDDFRGQLLIDDEGE